MVPVCVPATAILCPAAIEMPPIPAWLTETGLLTATPCVPMDAWACGKETARPPNPAFKKFFSYESQYQDLWIVNLPQLNSEELHLQPLRNPPKQLPEVSTQPPVAHLLH